MVIIGWWLIENIYLYFFKSFAVLIKINCSFVAQIKCLSSKIFKTKSLKKEDANKEWLWSMQLMKL